jgi:hypothetical protein
MAVEARLAQAVGLAMEDDGRFLLAAVVAFGDEFPVMDEARADRHAAPSTLFGACLKARSIQSASFIAVSSGYLA